MHAVSLSLPGAAANVCGLILLGKLSGLFTGGKFLSTSLIRIKQKQSFLGSEKNKDQTLPNAVSGAVPP